MCQNIGMGWKKMEVFFGTFSSNFQCSKMKYVMTEIKCLISELYLAKCKQSCNIGKVLDKEIPQLDNRQKILSKKVYRNHSSQFPLYYVNKPFVILNLMA